MSDERVVPGKTPVHNVQKHITRYNFALQFCQDKKVLDLACGSGYGTHLLSQVAKEAIGYDIDRPTIEYARNKYKADNISFYHSDLFDVPEDDYDVVVSFETIEHIEDLKKAQNKLLTLLKPGGLLVYSLPLNEERGFNEHHHHIFTPHQASKIFSSCDSIMELIQHGLNFFEFNPEWSANYSYYVAVKKRTA